jgi:UPF0755 protein
MKRFFRFLIGLISLGLVTLFAGGLWTIQQAKKPNGFDTAQNIVIEPGSSGLGIAHKLETQNLITSADIFYALLRLHRASVKAGEYEIPAHATMRDVLDLMREGKIVKREFTLAEGLTVKQTLILLQQNQFLAGDVTTPPVEGSLLPETYEFTRGDTRDSVIKRMQDAQKKLLADEWAKRDPAITLTTPEQAVILASIVEKETGKPEERPRIAGLFYNRLKIGMPLQTDPTVVYVITDKLGNMGGKALFSKDLEVDSPYNTYKNVGLPPGPIANPGKASLEAVLHPETNDYLFFVADGTGGHVFSTNLKDHESHVTQWRKIKKELNK